MKKNSIGILIAGFILYSISSVWGYIENGKAIQKNIERGVYIAKLPIKPKDLKKMPVPHTNDDYAFLQCIDDVSNVVIGNFKEGSRTLTLIQDRNSDGQVDRAVTYYIDRNSFKFSAKPWLEYSQEKFKKLKEDILKGRQDEIKPNKEGIRYIDSLQKNSELVQRWKNGYRIFLRDEVDDMTERMNFFASLSSEGADLVYQLNFRNKGVARVSPAINYSVFCKNSKDKLVIETTKKIIKGASKHMPYTD